MLAYYLSPITQAPTPEMVAHFITNITELYQLPSCKILLDLLLSQGASGNVTFQLEHQAETHKEEGTCQTLQSSFASSLKDKIFRRNIHHIVIRNNTPSVILHEMAHAIEKEINIPLEHGFIEAFQEDIALPFKGNPLFTQKMKRIMLDEVKIYNPKKRLSEIFARYFQLFAESRAITPSTSFFSYDEIERFFPHLQQWRNEKMIPALLPLINPLIAKKTEPLSVKKEKTKSWSQEKTSLHENASNPTWKKAVSSQFGSSKFNYEMWNNQISTKKEE